MVDAGTRAWKSTEVPELQRSQIEAKARLQLQALQMAGLDAAAMGPGDFALGLPFVIETHKQFDVPLVSANLTCKGLDGVPTFRVLDRDGIKVGVTAATDPSLVADPACTAGDVASGLTKAIKAMGQTDVVLVMAQLPDAPAEEALAKAVPGMDLLINGHTRKQMQEPKPLDNGAYLLGMGSRGKNLGLAEIQMREGAKGLAVESDPAALEARLKTFQQRMEDAEDALSTLQQNKGDGPARNKTEARALARLRHYEKQVDQIRGQLEAAKNKPDDANGLLHSMRPLDESIADHPATRVIVEATLTELARLSMTDNAPPLTDHPFMGSERCATCHTTQAAQFQTTKHATALESLREDNREHDMACFQCHVTGAFSTEGPQVPSQVIPMLEHSKPEAWNSSDETTQSTWKTYSYRQRAVNRPAPNQWREFIIGLLDAGEILVDDLSVIENPDGAATPFLQNGNFETGTDKWRLLGNHRHSRVIDDPDNPGNKVLHLIATGPTEHMHNHLETTLANNETVNIGTEYEIRFRARWLAGSNQFHTRLYFHKVAKTIRIDGPETEGTPGEANSIVVSNIGPTYEGLSHSPAVPKSGEAIEVEVRIDDPDGIASARIRYNTSGAWSSRSLNLDSDGYYRGTIPGQSGSTLIQFYIEAEDDLGETSFFPKAGPDSRALISS